MNTIKTYAFVITNTQTGEQFFDVKDANSRSYAKAKMTKQLPKFYVVTETLDYEPCSVSQHSPAFQKAWRLPCLNQHICNNRLTPYKGFRFVRQMFNPEGELKHTSTWKSKKQAIKGCYPAPDGYTVKVFQI
jgi:hypothetical protein